MIKIEEFREWAGDLDNGLYLAVDDEGLTVVALDKKGRETGSWLEVGGIPEPEDEP